MVVPRLLIIVGTSGVGKSTMSAKLASELGFSKVASTDTVREVLRTQLTSSEKPQLHRSSFESAGGSAVEDWEETVEVVSEGVQAVIERALEKRGDLLLEGVHYSPNILAIPPPAFLIDGASPPASSIISFCSERCLFA